MQWLSFIKELQARNIPLIVDLSPEDLDDFMEAMDPMGLFLWVAAEHEQEQIDILRRVEKWS
jgi:hypothetical protein